MSVQIVLSRARYAPGDTVQGYVLVTCDKPTHFNQVSLTFRGDFRIRWTDTVGNRRYIYGASQNIVNIKFILHQCAAEETLQPGEHKFPVSFKLDGHCPPTFAVSRFGGASYHLKAVVHRSGMLTMNLSSTGGLILDSPLDLDLFKERYIAPAALNALGNENRITVSVFLDKNVVDHEGKMTVHLIVDNQTRKPCRSVTLQAHEERVVFSNSYRRSSRRARNVVQFTQIDCNVDPFQSKMFTNIEIKWPNRDTFVADYVMNMVNITHQLQVISSETGGTVLAAMPVLIMPCGELSASLCRVIPQTRCTIAPLFKRPQWQLDDDAPFCPICTRTFNAFRRRHHCRACMQVYCSACSTAQLRLPLCYRMNSNRRVCNRCDAAVRSGLIPAEVGAIQAANAQAAQQVSNVSTEQQPLPPDLLHQANLPKVASVPFTIAQEFNPSAPPAYS